MPGEQSGPTEQPRRIPIVAESDGREHHGVLQPNGGVRLRDPRPEDELPEGMAYYPGTAYKLATGKSGPPSKWKYFDEQTGRWRSIKDLPHYEAMVDALDSISEYDPMRKRMIVFEPPTCPAG